MATRYVSRGNLQRQVENLPGIERKVEQVANDFVEVCKKNSNVDTGRYQANWKVKRIKKARAVAYRVYNDTPYAKFLEWGTRFMRAYRVLGRSIIEFFGGA